MKLHVLDKTKLIGEMAEYGFLFTENESIDSRKNLVILGAGEQAYACKIMLEKHFNGSRIFAFIDNDPT